MAKLTHLKSFSTENGDLTVLENLLLGGIKRVFFIYNTDKKTTRGNHRHKSTSHVLVCTSGSCKVDIKKNGILETFSLDKPDIALMLDPEDYRIMYDFSENTILLCLADTAYDKGDYLYEAQDAVDAL